MERFLKKQYALLALAIACFSLVRSQQVFFKSDQVFTAQQSASFYSSIASNKDLLLFNANDYKIYAYDLKSNRLTWVCETGYKTNLTPFIDDQTLYAGVFEDKQEWAAAIDLATGKRIKKFPFGPLVTRPFIQNNVLYGTGIYDAGSIVAYDLRKDTVLWNRFLAHGYSRQPYYLQDRIEANAEGDNWVAINYQGQLIDTNCKVKASLFVKDISCVKNYYLLTHDNREIKGKLAEKLGVEDFGDESQTLRTNNNTFFLRDGKLTILGNKLKIKQVIDISAMSDSIVADPYAQGKIVAADERNISILYNDQLIEYDYAKQQVKRVTDLANWKPHQLLINNDHLWLISKKDGLLYGISYMP